MNTKPLNSLFQKRKNGPAYPAHCGDFVRNISYHRRSGAIFGDGRYPDGLIGAWVLGWTMLGTYFLFAMKVASQWEKVLSCGWANSRD